LYLSFAQSRMLHGQVNYGMASSFLRELPEGLLHWLTPRFSVRKTVETFLPAQTLSPNPPPAGGWGEHVSAGEGVWRLGQRVSHQKFGEGVITGIEGSGADARVQVNFKHAGSKWLALEYAKLTAV
ncbi:MAG: DNA helicase II, partial [Nitrosomonadales bacterium]|nr:DNA helicase II [Nitrosomonadales bacterium]